MLGPRFFKKPAATAEELKISLEALDKEFVNLATFIKAFGGPYLTGPNFTMADSNCFLYVSLSVHNKIASLDAHPEVAKWYELCSQQPGPKRTLA